MGTYSRIGNGPMSDSHSKDALINEMLAEMCGVPTGNQIRTY